MKSISQYIREQYVSEAGEGYKKIQDLQNMSTEEQVRYWIETMKKQEEATAKWHAKEEAAVRFTDKQLKAALEFIQTAPDAELKGSVIRWEGDWSNSDYDWKVEEVDGDSLVIDMSSEYHGSKVSISRADYVKRVEEFAKNKFFGMMQVYN